MPRYLLDHVSLRDLERSQKYRDNLLAYNWHYYSELARQRSKFEDELKGILIESCTPDYEFKNWQRAVKWKYDQHPLCTLGSLKDPGGRFNIGDINPSLFPQFSALYIARDQPTARREILGHSAQGIGVLTPEDIALTSDPSIAIISIGGYLEQVFDLRNSRKLTKFVNLTKTFKITQSLCRQAKKSKLPKPDIIQKPKQLLDNLMDPNWRELPMIVDIPWNSQIFGQMLYSAGIEGVLYKSKLTNKECLAIYSNNFLNSDSYLQLEDEPPNTNTPRRIDSSNFKITEKNFLELS